MTWRPEVPAVLAQGLTIGGGVVAVIAMASMAGGTSILATPFSVWVLLPYVLVTTTIALRPSPLVGVIALLGAGLFGSILYLDLIFPSSRIRSTAALAFLFIPLWQLGFYVLALGLSFLFGARKRRSKPEPDSSRPGRAVSPLDVDAAFSSSPTAGHALRIHCPRCGSEANFGVSECRACEQPFEYPKT